MVTTRQLAKTGNATAHGAGDKPLQHTREKGEKMKTVNWRLVLVITAMVAMMLLAFYVEGTVPVWAR